MRFFLKRVFLFLSIFVSFFLLNVLVQKNFLYDKFFFKIPKDKVNLIVGHSHVVYGYNTEYISNSVNVGLSGESYFYNYFKTKKILESNPHIKKVFVEYTNNQIGIGMNDWIWGDKYLQKHLKMYFFLMDKESLNLIYTKNRQGFFTACSKGLFDNLHNVFKSRNILDGSIGGYLKSNENNFNKFSESNKKLSKKSNAKYSVSYSNLYYLEKIVKLCKKKNVKCYFVRTPMHKSLLIKNSELVYKKIRLSKFQAIPFLDFKDFYLPNSCFLDKEHLNTKGAKIYSKFFNDTIQKLK